MDPVIIVPIVVACVVTFYAIIIWKLRQFQRRMRADILRPLNRSKPAVLWTMRLWAEQPQEECPKKCPMLRDGKMDLCFDGCILDYPKMPHLEETPQ